MHRYCTIGLIAMCLVESHAEAAMIFATADSYVTQHSGLGGTSSTHGSDGFMFLIGPAPFISAPLILFDLTPYSASVLTAPVQLQMAVVGVHSAPEFQDPVSVHAVLANWDEASVTWNNFGPSPGLNPGVDYVATPAATITISGAVVGSLIDFSLPASLVQSWIDNPSLNRGLIMVSSYTGFNNDIHFGTREGGMAAKLISSEFVLQDSSTVPEPASIALLGVGVVGMLGLRRCRHAAASGPGAALST